MSDHCAARSHLNRFVECVCLGDYETVDHCGRFETERRRLTDAFAALDARLGPPVRDLCAQKKWRALKCCLDFFGVLELEFDELAVLFKDSWSNITSDLRWIWPVVQLGTCHL
jgi:hypothetical protein